MTDLHNLVITKEMIDIIKSSHFWDEDFYKAQVSISFEKIDPLLHFVVVGAPIGLSPSAKFDLKRYIENNPDVYNSGINPLYHYIKHGRFELRDRYEHGEVKRKKDETWHKSNVVDRLGKVEFKNGRVAIFASYSADGTIKDYIRYYLEDLKESCDAILFISDNYYSPLEMDKICDLVDYHSCSRHAEYDFGSYKRGLEVIFSHGLDRRVDEIVMANDSSYGPIYGLAELFREMEAKDAAFWGITNATQGDEHIQSYFYVFKKQVFTHPVFRDFFQKVKAESSQSQVILNYETRLTSLLMNEGFRYASRLNVRDYADGPKYNFEEHQLTAIKNGSPFIKRKKIIDFNRNFDGYSTMFRDLAQMNRGLYNLIRAEGLLNTAIDQIAFSIIMPTFNRKEMAINAIDSALYQTHQNFELIVVDDSSTDGTAGMIMEKYGKQIRNGKIRLLVNESNMGAAASRNRGLGNAGNDWIAYLDSDNIMDEKFLEYFAIAILNNSDVKTFYAMATMFPGGETQDLDFNWNRIVDNNFIDLGVFVHHRKLTEKYGKFDTNLLRLIDYELILRLTEHNRPYYIRTPLLRYNNGRHERITTSQDYERAYLRFARKYSKKPIVSTIIPTYNHEKYIRNAIESALLQKGDFLPEIIISDDGSSDGTRELVREYAERFSHIIRDISSGENLGVSGNFKKCIDAATGKYIAVLEGDDYWNDPLKLQTQFQYMEKTPDCAMCFSGSYILDNENFSLKIPPRQNNLPAKIHLTTLCKVHNPMITFSSTFYKARVLKIVPDCLYAGRLSEYALAFFFCEFGNIGFIKEKQNVYRQHADSLWTGATKRSQLLSSIQTYRNIIDIDPKKFASMFDEAIKILEQQLEQLSEEELASTYFSQKH